MARCDVQICIWSKRCQHELDQRKLSSGNTDDGRMVEQPQHVSYIWFQENCNTPLEHTPNNPPSQLWKESLHIMLVKVDRGVFQRCGATTWDWFIWKPRGYLAFWLLHPPSDQGSQNQSIWMLENRLMVICTLENFYARWKTIQIMYFLSFFSMDQGSSVEKNISLW